MKSNLIKSQKYAGVYYNKLDNGDKSFYITYKDLNKKKVWTKIGLYSSGIRESYCSTKRAEVINLMKLGESPNIIKNNRTEKEVITFGAIADEYLQYKKNKLTAGSIREITSKYKNHIEPYLSNKDIESITKSDIENIVEQKYKQLANKTLNIITDLIGTIFNFAIENDKYKKDNPAVKAYRYPVDNNRERTLTKDEIKKLIEAVKEKDNLTYIFTILSLSTGGRINTICNIQKKHIDLSSRIIKLKDFKNNKTYSGYIKKEYLQTIEEHIKHLEPNDYILGEGDLVKKVQRRLRPILDELFNQGLDSKDSKNRFVIHSLRHTFATQLILNQTPIFIVQKLLNHSDIKMTMRYINIDSYFMRDYVDEVY